MFFLFNDHDDRVTNITNKRNSCRIYFVLAYPRTLCKHQAERFKTMLVAFFNIYHLYSV